MTHSKKTKMPDYPIYRRNGDAFYKIVDEETVTKIEPDMALDYYEYCGLTGEDANEVKNYDPITEQTWDTVLDDMKECCRVGSRPTIPPPPEE